MKVNSEMLVESKTLRETVIDRVDVLDKVKALSMLPGDLYVTIEMASKYFEVHKDAVEKVIRINRYELIEDGMKVLKGNELSALKAETHIPRKIPSITVLNRRAVLRIGMLLQESEVAKAVRSYLLDKEEEQLQPLQVPQNFKEALLALVGQIDENEHLKGQLALNQPKVLFAESLEVSEDTVLVGDLAKLLKQNGIDIGGTRLFTYLRENGYLISRHGEDFNLPTQKSMNLGLMVVRMGSRMGANGKPKVTRTPKITGKGQIYFVNKFKKKEESN